MPVASAHCGFFSEVSLWFYYPTDPVLGQPLGSDKASSNETITLVAHMRAPRNTRSKAHSGLAMVIYGFARAIYMDAQRRVGTVHCARQMTECTKCLNLMLLLSGRRPRGEGR